MGRQELGEQCAGNLNAARSSGRAERELRLIFGQNGRAERLKRGMSQAELGEECGLLQEYVSAVESGRLNLTIGTMVRIALALETEVLRLLRRRR
jgi:ribosome-binding protein aMBF1 (putative translation factor)